jgi:hypothetical protein
VPAPVVESAGSRTTWRVGHTGRDEMYYEELVGGSWARIRISGEMLMGRAHHVIYFASPHAWRNYPDWARARREEIIARIKSEFRAPDYEYQGDGGIAAAPRPAEAPVAPTPRRTSGIAVTPSQYRALLIAIAIMLAIAGGASWLVVHGLVAHETWSPNRRASQQRVIQRAQEPAMFWTAFGIYAMVAAGAFGLAAWGAREGWRLRQPEKD